MVDTDLLLRHIRSVPDFPRKGIVFRDITTLLKDRVAFSKCVETLLAAVSHLSVDKVVSVESRGFIFGSVLADRLGAGFVPVRKPGKLPARTIREEYVLEYGSDVLEIHADAIEPGERILVVDDLLATGGTAVATARLVERLGGSILAFAFLIELSFLRGRERLNAYEVISLIDYKSE
jgi:adenine phosphoribosyltransferase